MRRRDLSIPPQHYWLVSEAVYRALQTGEWPVLHVLKQPVVMESAHSPRVEARNTMLKFDNEAQRRKHVADVCDFHKWWDSLDPNPYGNDLRNKHACNDEHIDTVTAMNAAIKALNEGEHVPTYKRCRKDRPPYGDGNVVWTENGEPEVFVPTDELALWAVYATEGRLPERGLATLVGQALATVATPGKPVRCTIGDGGRMRGQWLPPLPIARQRFERAAAKPGPLDWSDVDKWRENELTVHDVDATPGESISPGSYLYEILTS